MKNTFRSILAGALLAPIAVFAANFEGKVTMKMTDGRKSNDMTYSIKKDKVRIEMGGADNFGATIIDNEKREMVVIINEMKMYMSISMDTAKKTAEKVVGEVKFEKTSETEKILGYTATKYISTSKDGVSDVWLAEGLGTFMSPGKNPMAGGRGDAPKGWEAALAGKELFPMRVVTKNKSGKEINRMEVTAINKEKLADTLFVIPEGYQQFSMGNMMKGLIPGFGR